MNKTPNTPLKSVPLTKSLPCITELSLYKREALCLTTEVRDMGYQPSFNVERGLNLSVRWLRNVGLVEHCS